MVYTNSATANASLKSCHNPCQSHLLSTFVRRQSSSVEICSWKFVGFRSSKFSCRKVLVEVWPSKFVRPKFVRRSSFVGALSSELVRRNSFAEVRPSKLVRRNSFVEARVRVGYRSSKLLRRNLFVEVRSSEHPRRNSFVEFRPSKLVCRNSFAGPTKFVCRSLFVEVRSSELFAWKIAVICFETAVRMKV